MPDAEREKLMRGAQKLADLEQALIDAHRALIEAAECFQFGGEIVSQSPQPVRIPTHVVGMDSNGEVVAMDMSGNVLYKSSEGKTYVGPFRVWVCDSEGVIRKQYVDQYDLVDSLNE